MKVYSRSLKTQLVIGMEDGSSLVAELNLELDTAHKETDHAPVRLNCSNIMVLTGLLEQTIARFYEGEVMPDNLEPDYADDEDETLSL
jgi:hypothetical protein